MIFVYSFYHWWLVGYPDDPSGATIMALVFAAVTLFVVGWAIRDYRSLMRRAYEKNLEDPEDMWGDVTDQLDEARNSLRIGLVAITLGAWALIIWAVWYILKFLVKFPRNTLAGFRETWHHQQVLRQAFAAEGAGKKKKRTAPPLLVEPVFTVGDDGELVQIEPQGDDESDAEFEFRLALEDQERELFDQ